jgi:hypothetical protein
MRRSEVYPPDQLTKLRSVVALLNAVPRRYHLLGVEGMHRSAAELLVAVSGARATAGPRPVGNLARPEVRVCTAMLWQDALAAGEPGLRALSRGHAGAHA